MTVTMPERSPPALLPFPGRVLMVNKFHYRRGGAEHYLFDVADVLRREGVEVVHFAMADERNLPVATDRFFASHVDFEQPTGSLERARVAARALYSLESRRRIERLLAAEAVDVAHVHNIYHQLSPSVLAPLRKRGIPVVM